MAGGWGFCGSNEPDQVRDGLSVEEAMEKIRNDADMQVVLMALKLSSGLEKDEAIRAARLVIHKGFTEDEACKIVRYDRGQETG